jgi:hypothetical protein
MTKKIQIGSTILLALAAQTLLIEAQSHWWQEEPIRLLQTTLRETDAGLDAKALIEQIAAFPANTLVFGMGGINAYYPTQVPFHYASPYLPPGKDLLREVLNEAHRQKMRLIGRFDFSRARKEVYEAHPEWFFIRADGNPVHDHNNLYTTCINGGYYREQSLKILAEALDRYEVDGLFFNWFGNQAFDYGGKPMGTCQCDSCKTRFQERYHRSLPTVADDEYQEFMRNSAREVAAKFAALIRSKRPEAAFITYIRYEVSGIASESDKYMGRSLPIWLYNASENVMWARSLEPEKMALNYIMPYVDMRYRFSCSPVSGLKIYLYQNMSHGTFPAFAMLGTPDQPDSSGLKAIRPIYQWHARHEDLFVGQENAARVLLVIDPKSGTESSNFRGFFRLLSELHIPFRLADDLSLLDKQPGEFDLVVLPEGGKHPELDRYLRKGGSVLAAGIEKPALELPPTVKLWPTVENAYWRINQEDLFPSLSFTRVLFLEGRYLELESQGFAPLTLIPQSSFSPPEKVSRLEEVTNKPGLILTQYGKGQLAYLPWEIGQLYYRQSNDSHRRLISDLIDRLLPAGRQLITTAHPLVEMTLMNQPAQDRTLLHLINLSGHSGTAFFEPIPMGLFSVTIKRHFVSARLASSGAALNPQVKGESTTLNVPQLNEYDVVILK